MAVERLFLAIKQDIMAQASDLSEQGAHLLREGKQDEAEAKLAEVSTVFVKVKAVDEILPDILARLSKAGIDQPTEAYLLKIFKKTVSKQAKTQPDEPKPQGQDSPKPDQQKGKESSKSRDLAKREEKVARALFALNDDGSDFLHPTFQDVLTDAFADVLERYPEDERKKRSYKLVTPGTKIRESIIRKIHAAETKPVPARLNEFMKWLRSQPQYQILDSDSLARVAKREQGIDDLPTLPNRFPGSTEHIPHVLVTFGEDDITVKTVKTQAEEIDEQPGLNVDQEAQSVEIDGKKIRLKGKSWELVNALCENKGWIDSEDLVGQTSFKDTLELTRQIFVVRKKFGESAKEQKYLLGENHGPHGSKYMLRVAASEIIATDETHVDTSNEASQQGVAAQHEPVVTRESSEVDKLEPFTGSEIYQLASSIISNDSSDKFKIPHPDDRKEIKEIIERLDPIKPDEIKVANVQTTIVQKLSAFVADKAAVFTANVENEDAQFLLTLLASIESQDQIEELFLDASVNQ